MAKLYRKLWFTSVLCIIPIAGFAMDLNVATYHYTSNWNPISHVSYPAYLATKATHESLFMEKCTGEVEQDGKSSFAQVCLDSRAKPSRRGSVKLSFRENKCMREGVSLSVNDVQYTIDQINEINSNPAYSNRLYIQKPNRLRVGFPSPLNAWAAKNILSFPLLRWSETSDLAPTYHSKVMREGDEDILNIFSGGTFKYEQIRRGNAQLKFRHIVEGADPPSYDTININYYPLFMNMLTQMNSVDNSPHIALGFPAAKAKNISGDRYKYVASPDLNSFTYVGFNFKTKNRRSHQLIQNQNFRALFSQSLWAVSKIRTALDIDQKNSRNSSGVFIGQSFDYADPRYPDTPKKTTMTGRIKTFISRYPGAQKAQLRVLISPSITFIFDEGDRKNISRELNDMWGSQAHKGVKFKFIDPTGGRAAYEKQRNAGQFDLLFETFIYGRNRLRYFDFIEKDNPLNYLGIDLFSRETIESYKKSGNEGRIKLIDLVEQRYPVAVIGYLPARDLHAQRIHKKFSCPPGSFPEPYAAIFLKQPN